MIHLGINQDRYDSGVALTDGERVLYAANEERFTRCKSQGGLPLRSLAAAFEQSGVRPEDVERICVAGVMTPPLPMRALPTLHFLLFRENVRDEPAAVGRLIDFILTHTPVAHTSADSLLRRATLPLLAPLVRRTLGKSLRRQPIRFVEHHHGHAAAAFRLSGFEQALCITCDGMGDGLSMTVARCAGDRIERLWSANSFDSFGRFFEALTEAFGFIPCRHEGKITGLAAYGEAERVAVASPFTLIDGRLRYSGPHGRRAVGWLREVCAGHRREDVAAWAQAMLEHNAVAIARSWLQRSGLRRLAVAGGVFANVKLNQRLHELDEVDELFVCPNMGDGGLSLGAICAEGGYARGAIDDVFWGDGFTEAEMRAALDGVGIAHERLDNIDEHIAAALAAGEIVGVFRDRMEWGPRALGNRSILAPAIDARINQRLNTLLERSEFMPFAPAVLDADAELYFESTAAARRTAQFMTTCFRATAKMRRDFPAVVHVDGTVRAQLVGAQTNPRLHAILTAYKQRTGHSVVLNTSFNIHEEPIVRTPAEAVATFGKARLDGLALGSFWARRSDPPL